MNKNLKIGLIVSGILLLIVVVFVAFRLWEKSSNTNVNKVVNRDLSDSARQTFEGKISDLQKMLIDSKNNTDKYNIYVQIGIYEYALGLLQESKDSFGQALKIDANRYDVYQGLFQTEIDMMDYSGAEANIKKAISLRKGIANLWKKYIEFKTIQLNASNDQIKALYTDALADIKESGDAANTVDIYTSYATWLEKSGDLKGAIEYWQKAIEINPDSKAMYQAEINRIKKL